MFIAKIDINVEASDAQVEVNSRSSDSSAVPWQEEGQAMPEEIPPSSEDEDVSVDSAPCQQHAWCRLSDGSLLLLSETILDYMRDQVPISIAWDGQLWIVDETDMAAFAESDVPALPWPGDCQAVPREIPPECLENDTSEATDANMSDSEVTSTPKKKRRTSANVDDVTPLKIEPGL